MNPETTKTIFICYAVVSVAALLLSIPGIIWGRKEKLIVYHGSADLILSCVTLPVVVNRRLVLLCLVCVWAGKPICNQTNNDDLNKP